MAKIFSDMCSIYSGLSTYASPFIMFAVRSYIGYMFLIRALGQEDISFLGLGESALAKGVVLVSAAGLFIGLGARLFAILLFITTIAGIWRLNFIPNFIPTVVMTVQVHGLLLLALLLALIITQGPGKLSLDFLLQNRSLKRAG